MKLLKLEITSATKDTMTREWEVITQINGKQYKYTLSDYDYKRAMKYYHRRYFGRALNIIKGVK